MVVLKYYQSHLYHPTEGYNFLLALTFSEKKLVSERPENLLSKFDVFRDRRRPPPSNFCHVDAPHQCTERVCLQACAVRYL